MKLSEEMAVRLHRMMWSDMQKELGDKPSGEERLKYKSRWIEKHFPGEKFMHNCILCEYVMQQTANKVLVGSNVCKLCPIKWPGNNCSLREREGGTDYLQSPISEILALPARNNCRDLEEAVTPEDHEYKNAKKLLSDASGLEAYFTVGSHIKKIQEKAVEEYFESKPGAKLATMDVDRAFKQYADEQKAPIFRALAEASGLDGNRPVEDHIRKIVKDSTEIGAAEERDRIQEKIYEVLLS